MEQPSIFRGGFQRVSNGVSVVEQVPITQCLALVLGDHFSLDRHASLDNFGGQLIFQANQVVSLLLEGLE